jgi:hypothetical protein
MSQLVKTKRQVNFKDFKRFGASKGVVEQKDVVFNSFVCKLGLFWHEWANLHTNSLNKLLFFLCAVICDVSHLESVRHLLMTPH